MKPLRIVVAEDEAEMRKYLATTLPRVGHDVAGAAENGRELVDLCRTVNPDVVITDIKMPEMDGIEAAMQIFRERPVPVILLTAYHDAEHIHRAELSHILGYLIKPIKEVDLGPAIAIAIARFEQFQELHREATDLRQALEDRKLIERAKGILMKRAVVDEQEAFRRLQKLATSKRQKLIEAAHMILSIDSIYEPSDDGGDLAAR